MFLFLFSQLLAQVESKRLSFELKEKPLPFGLVQQIPTNYPKISLVLSGGGARGISQIGVLRVLDEAGIPISSIIGTSMGSLIGGMYSAGYSINEIDSIVRNLPWDEFFSIEEANRYELFVDQKLSEDRAIFSIRFDGLKPVIPTSINTGQKVSNYLNLVTLNAPIHVRKKFDELLFDFKAVSTDLISGEPYVLEDGSLALALRASSSISLLLAPVYKDSLLLVDGGLVSNIPTTIAQENEADLIIAVNTSSPLKSEEELKLPWNIADQMVSIPMKILNDQELAAADFVIEPNIGTHENSDFTNLAELITLGEIEAREHIDEIRQFTDNIIREKLCANDISYTNFSIEADNHDLNDYLNYKYSDYKEIFESEILLEIAKILRDGNFLNVFADIEYSGSSVKIIFKTESYPKVNQINLNGIKSIDVSEFDSITGQIEGFTFNNNIVLDLILTILKEYRANGFSLATLTDFQFDGNTGVLDLNFIEGRIASINLIGNDKTMDDVILREFNFSSGELFQYSEVEKGLANLRTTNLFNSIELQVSRTNSDYDLNIVLEEKISSLMRFGLRIDNENQTQVLIDLRDENLFGTGSELGLIFTGGLRNRSLILENRANRLFDTYLTYKIRAYHEFRDYNLYENDEVTLPNRFSRSKVGEYRQKRIGFSAGLGAQVEKIGSLFGEFKIQTDEIANKLDYTGDTYNIVVAMLRVNLLIDSQNKFPFPNRGVLFKLGWESAQQNLGSDVSFTKFEMDYKAYFPISLSHNLNARFVLGFGDETLPLSQQFSFGGQNHFFGFRDSEYRGRQVFLSSLEYRYTLPVKLFFDSYLKFRYDLGSVWSQREQIRFKDLRHGLGLSLSLDTPIGPAEFAIGKSFLIKRQIPENILVWGDTQFYFTIGYYY